MNNKELKVTSLFTVKALDDDSITIEGIANSTSKDRTGDIILADAWTKGGLKNFKKNPIVLAFHDHRQPIGKVTELSPTESGLSVVAKIINTSDNVFKMIANGILKAFSVSFIIKDATFDPIEDIFFIKDLELLEISVVSVGMNQDSTFSIRKSFDTEEGYMEFKKQFIITDSLEHEAKAKDTKQELLEFKEDLTKQIVQGVSAALSKEEKRFMRTPEEIAAEEAAKKAAEEKAAEEKAAEEAKRAATTGNDRVEKLLEDLNNRVIAAEEKAKKDSETREQEETALAKETAKAIEELNADLKEKSDELKALQSQKDLWSASKTVEKITDKEMDTAVLVAKIMGKSITSTDYFKKLTEKVAGDPGEHLINMTDDWEQEFSTRLWNDIRQALVVEPMFDVIQMTTPTLQLPVNPEAGTATWIASTAFRGTNSTGTAEDHTLIDETMTAYKLAAKEYLGYEEEEDSIIPLVPIIQAAVARRMARSSDIAVLRGTGASSADPISGLTTLTVSGSKLASADQPSISAADKVTVAMLQSTRRLLGKWGLNPADVRYLVSEDAYFDLLEDPDFRTIDMVGSKATILTGQIGFANGSPIITSGEFASKAAGIEAVIAVNTSNFKVGVLRSMLVERDRNIEEQKNILVASRRMAFKQIIASNAVATAAWKA